MAISNATRLSDFGAGIGTQGAVLQIDNTNDRIGIGTTNPGNLLQVGDNFTVDDLGGINASGVVTATTFSGNLTGTPTLGTGVTVTASGVDVTGIITAGTFKGDALTVNNDATVTTNFKVSGITTLSGNVTIGGTLTYEDVTNVDSVGLVTARTGVRVTAGGVVVTAGVATFSAPVNINSTPTFSEGLNVSAGVVTVAGNQTVAGTSSFAKKATVNATLDATEGLHVSAGVVTIAGNQTVAGTSSFAKKATVNATLDATEGLHVSAGVATFAGAIDIGNVDVTLDGSATGVTSVTWDASADSLIFKDNVTAKFGDGSDLNLYHDGTNSWIVNKTGYLGIGAKHGENGAIINPDASVDLYYDNSKKIETTTAGVVVTGICTATTLVGRHGAVTTVSKSAQYTLVNGDQGKMIITDSEVIVPGDVAGIGAGDVFTVCNSSGSDINITKGTGINLYTIGSSTNATVTLAQKGIAVITCFANNDFIVGGGGVS